MKLYTAYSEFQEKKVKNVSVFLSGGLDRDSVKTSSIVGYCFFSGHKGYLTKRIMKEHECLQKGCKYFLKFSDYPFWVERARIKKARSEERELRNANNDIANEIKLMAQRVADKRKYSIIITGVNRKDDNHYIINYVSDRARNDYYLFFSVLAEISKVFDNMTFYLRHIKNLSGRFATIDDYAAAQKQ